MFGDYGNVTIKFNYLLTRTRNWHLDFDFDTKS